MLARAVLLLLPNRSLMSVCGGLQSTGWKHGHTGGIAMQLNKALTQRCPFSEKCHMFTVERLTVITIDCGTVDEGSTRLRSWIATKCCPRP